MKVLQVLDSMKQRFGVTSVVMNYYTNIDRNKIQFEFLIYEDSDQLVIDKIKELGGTIHYMPRLSMKNIYNYYRFMDRFFAEHNDYVAVHSHFNQVDFIVFRYAKKHGIKSCISHSHNTKYSDFKLKAIRNWLMCLPIKSNATTWAACSNAAGEFLYGSDFINSKKSLIINNAVDCKKFKFNPVVRNEVRKEFGLTDEYVIGNVGSFKIQKNQEFLLKLFSGLKKSDIDTNYKLMLVGDGYLRERLENLAKNLQVYDDVIFTGVRTDVPNLLQVMDVFVLPSLYEGLPVIGVEAQAASLPCIFSSNITKEVNITDVIYLDLDAEISEWIKAIKECIKKDRVNTEDVITKKGFNIKNEADKLLKYYSSLG